ncbi:MAG TPA: DUF2382 domain-containing protein [Bryobacteraceae bacterium]|nr:DUF2382 domain-containing protein [Bryobacteraceae bacterium]
MANATMRTAVGVFKDYGTAQAVAEELEGSGFQAENIQVTGGTAASDYAASHKPTTTHHHEGGIAGFFRRLFGAEADEEETKYYERAVQSGNAVVTVDADESQINYAIEIMNRRGALEVEKGGPPSGDRSVEGEKSIPVVEEELQVGKRAVQRGGVRIYSRVIDRPVEEQVTLREEHINVERRPVDRPISAADTAELRDQTIEVTETAEEPVVSKRARVVEEVSIGKETTERTETIRDNVKSTDVKVEKTGSQQAGRTTENNETDFRRDFETRYAGSGVNYETYGPAYEYGYSTASDPRFRGKSWEDVESTLKTDYLRNNPNSTWDKVRGAVRYGWEKVTGKRASAS